ncbi:hypothetical protein BRARA_I02839 [Brassica rapa]|uniref:DUF1985 domain-containing protein n=1 Tax=Brassica campestris TaxID=3711 RepID=A0A397Y050_BRACM|nr:hypothetical protein BRARA_I02839 [Brassica rapa]
MVSCRLVDLPEDDVTDAVPPIPDMMFAAGEEPVGVRVLTYQSSRAINHILNSLEEDEIQTLRKSPFGKIVDIAEKPGFSGRFTRYILSRQLKVEKKHEAWFRFAGKPIRFSLREFAIVTGLNCGEYPKSSVVRSKKNKNVKPYWPELFGKSEDLRVSTALKMLRRKTVTEKEVRIKLACLAIVSSVLLATNLKMKMIKEHAEAMVDLEEFYSFPWGRLAFEMLIGSIKQRDEVSLSQNTIAVKGFALALQLVMIEAVPDLTAVVLETCSSSESDSCDDDDDFTHKKTKKKTLSPGHAREIDKKTNVIVRSIIPEDPDRPLIPANLVWADEVLDVKVENLLKLIAQSHPFTAEMFKGGATKLDVERMRELGRAGGKQKRKTKTQTNTETVEDKRIAAIVLSMLKPEVERVEANVAKAVSMAEDTATKFASFDTTVMVSIQNLLNNFKDEVIRSVMQIHNSANAPTQPTQPDVDTTNHVQRKVDIVHPHPDPNDDIIAQVIGSLSQYSTPPRNASVCPVVDILVRFVRATCNMQQHSSLGRIPEFLDSRYVALLFKHFPKFSRSKTPDAYPFPKGLFELLRKDNPTGAAVTHYYFPFDLGNKQWVGVCFDCTAWKLTVLDCNISIRSDSQIATQLRPFAEMIPSLLKRTGRISNTTAYHGVVIERPKVVAQNTNPSHSALTSILLMQTHAIFGLESCRCITPTLLTEEAHRVAVMLYELHEKL